MTHRSDRHREVQRLIVEIGRGTDRGDHVATLIHIRDAVRSGRIRPRDAQRLTTFLTAIHGDRLADHVH